MLNTVTSDQILSLTTTAYKSYLSLILLLVSEAICSFVMNLEGFLCNCVLPTSLNETRVRHIKPEDGMYKKKKLRTTHSDSSIPSSSQQQQQQQPNNSSSVSSKSARHRNSSSC